MGNVIPFASETLVESSVTPVERREAIKAVLSKVYQLDRILASKAPGSNEEKEIYALRAELLAALDPSKRALNPDLLKELEASFSKLQGSPEEADTNVQVSILEQEAHTKGRIAKLLGWISSVGQLLPFRRSVSTSKNTAAIDTPRSLDPLEAQAYDLAFQLYENPRNSGQPGALNTIDNGKEALRLLDQIAPGKNVTPETLKHVVASLQAMQMSDDVPLKQAA